MTTYNSLTVEDLIVKRVFGLNISASDSINLGSLK